MFHHHGLKTTQHTVMEIKYYRGLNVKKSGQKISVIFYCLGAVRFLLYETDKK